MQRRSQDDFSILLPAEDAVLLFGERLNISRITEVPQLYCQLCFILNLPAQPDKGTPSVNGTTNREIVLELVQFGQVFPRILQAIWEADPANVPVCVSKLDVMDAYHHSTFWPSWVVTFPYIISSDPEDAWIILFINIVLPMGWVDSLNFFCAFSEN